MEFLKTTKFYLRLFYIIGLSPFAPTDHHGKKLGVCTTGLSKIPMILQTLFGLCISSLCAYGLFCSMRGSAATKDRSEIFITSMFILCQIARTLLALMQCIFYKKVYYSIINALNALEGYFTVHFQHRIRYSLFTSGVVKKMSLATVGFTQMLIAEFLDSNQIDFPVRLLQAASMLTCCHLVFFIDVLSFHLEQLLVVIIRDTANDRSIDSVTFYKQSAKCVFVRNQLKHYKTVHFTLWEISQCINKFFGWTMVAILLQVFIDLLYCSYCLFDELQDTLVVTELMRKWICWNI